MSMKPLFLVSLAVFAPAVYAGPSDWKPSTIAAKAFAKNVDSRIINLKDAKGVGSYVSKLPIGEILGNLTLKIRNSKAFRIETIALMPSTRTPSTMIVAARNKKGIFIWNKATSKMKKLKPGQDPGFGATLGILDAWQTHFQQLIFQSYFTQSSTFQTLVSELMQPKSGFTVRVDERTLTGNGRQYPQARIFAKLKPELAKKFGNASIEIVADAKMWLPLQVSVRQDNKDKTSKVFLWTMAWNGPAKFKDSELTAP